MSIWILLCVLALPVTGIEPEASLEPPDQASSDQQNELIIGDNPEEETVVNNDLKEEANTNVIKRITGLNNVGKRVKATTTAANASIDSNNKNAVSNGSVLNNNEQDKGSEDIDLRQLKLDSNDTHDNLSLHDLLDIYCPGVNVCPRDTLGVQSRQTRSTPIACCTACSCSETCHTTRDCCFPSDADQDKVRHTTCYSSLYPVLQDFMNEKLGYKSYKMIDSLTFDTSDNSTADCGNKNVAPWGSLFPVYSESRRLIYKNSECATADGADDFIRFTVFLKCSHPEVISRGVLFSGTDWENFEEECDVFFEPPVDSSLLREHECYLNLISTCPAQFDDGAIVSHHQLESMCTSGLMSPYKDLDFKTYKNVFCAVCNGQFHLKSCPANLRDTRLNRKFLALLEDVAYENFDQRFPMENMKQACLIKDGQEVADTCRPVHCSTGQMLNSDGVCTYIIKAWYQAFVTVELNITSEVELDMTELRASDFQHEWGSGWDINAIYTLSDEDTPLTKSFMVFLFREFKVKVSQRYIIQRVKLLKNKKWTVSTRNGSVELKAEFADAKDRFDISISRVGRYWKHIKYVGFFFDSGHLSLGRSTGAYDLHRMYYCQQVDLRPHEFTELDRAINNNITGKQIVLPDFYYPDFDDHSIVRTCVEDSGLVVRSSGSTTLPTVIMVISVVLSLTFYFHIY